MATKEEVQALRAEMYRMEARLIKWMVGAVVASAIAVGSIAVAAMTLINYFLG